MAINPKQVSVEQLFGNIRYFVDFYQREYKWSDSNQTFKPVKSLLDDIFYRFRLNYDPNLKVDSQAIASYEWYYLNSYMTNTVDGKTYIVDGQQRLTTLTLVLIALIKIGKKLDVDSGILQYLSNKVCGYGPDGIPQYWMGFSDRKDALSDLNNLQDGLFQGDLRGCSISAKNIYEAYNVIYQYLNDSLINEHLYNAFRLYFTQRIYLINIDVDEAKDVAMAFEVINDRGIPLKAYEILKGKVLNVIPKNDVEPFVDIWESSIDQLADQYPDEIIDLFLSTYFQSKFSNSNTQYNILHKERYHKSIYLEEFNAKIGLKSKGPKDSVAIKNVKEFVSEILPFYSKLYLQILLDSNNDRAPNLFPWFNRSNDQDYQFYLIMSAISLNDPLRDEKYKLVSRLFDRMYVMANLTSSYRSNEFASSVLELGRQIRNKAILEIQEAFDKSLVSYVKKQLNRENIKSLDDVFKYDLFSGTGYINLGKKFLRYFFGRIDHLISEESNLPTSSYYGLIRQASGKEFHHVEHILANDSNGFNRGLFKDEEDFIHHRNRLGGLVLLKGKDNQSSGNELYPDKLKTYSHATLFAQTLAPNFSHSNVGFKNFCKKYQLVFKQYPIFDGNSIEERQQLLHQLVKIIWGY